MLSLLLVLLLSTSYLVASTQTPHEQLISLAASNNGVIKLDAQTWDLLISSKRTWSAAVQLTALDKNMKCVVCREFNPAFNAVAKAWTTVSNKDRDNHFFATLDYRDGEDIFRKLGVVSAPLVSFYPAVNGPLRPVNGKTDPSNYDFNNYGAEAKDLAEQLSHFTPVPIPYRPPFNWGLLGTAASTLLVLAVAARLLLPVLLNRWTWAFLTIGTSLVMTSGFMFVRIRGMPYRTATSTMLSGYQNQVGQEIWTISFTYGCLAASIVALTVLVPQQSSQNRQRAGIYIFSILNIFLFSMLLSFFRIKNGGYPFRLLM